MTELQKQVRVRSRRIAEEYLRAGWEIISPLRSATGDLPHECMLVWPGDGAPVQPDWSYLQQMSEQNQQLA